MQGVRSHIHYFLPWHERSFRFFLALEKAHELLDATLRRVSKGRKLTLIQVRILLALAGSQGSYLRLTELSEGLKISKPSLSNTLKRLEAQKYIRRRQKPQDRRSFLLTLTPQGKAVLKGILRELTPLLSLFKGLPFSSELYYHLLEFLHQCQREGLISEQRLCFSCAHYRSGNDGTLPFCELLKTPLPPAEHRIQCPDHRAIEG